MLFRSDEKTLANENMSRMRSCSIGVVRNTSSFVCWMPAGCRLIYYRQSLSYKDDTQEHKQHDMELQMSIKQHEME